MRVDEFLYLAWYADSRSLFAAIFWSLLMTEATLPDPVGSQGQASAQSAGTQTGAGAGVATQGYAAQGYEGSTKQVSDIGTEEADAIVQSTVGRGAAFDNDLMSANKKRTADQLQSVDLSALSGDRGRRDTLDNLMAQALQNAIETANMVSKQAVRHSDIAIDRQWNINETDNMAAVVAAVMAEMAKQGKTG